MKFSQKLHQAISDKHLLKHPYYQAWNEGKLTRDDLQTYAQQYYAQVDLFPRCVSAIHSQCGDAQGRKMLMENLIEEEGMTAEEHADHPELWIRFGEGLGSTRESMTNASPYPETADLNDKFFSLCRQSYAEGLAALYTYEYQIPKISEVKIKGLKEFYNIHDDKTLSFFAVHQEADVEHSVVCADLLDRLDEKEQEKALGAAKTTAHALWDFLSGVQRETLDKRTAQAA